MPIPINPTLIAGAQTYPNNYSAIPMNVCKAPREGALGVPMQFLFNVNPTWVVDMTGGLPLGNVSQISSMYVDCLNSNNNVIIVFPDTGYEVQINAGKTLLFPVFTGNTQLPKFYVCINGGQPTSDTVNIILLNFFIPEFAAP